RSEQKRRRPRGRQGPLGSKTDTPEGTVPARSALVARRPSGSRCHYQGVDRLGNGRTGGAHLARAYVRGAPPRQVIPRRVASGTLTISAPGRGATSGPLTSPIPNVSLVIIGIVGPLRRRARVLFQRF